MSIRGPKPVSREYLTVAIAQPDVRGFLTIAKTDGTRSVPDRSERGSGEIQQIAQTLLMQPVQTDSDVVTLNDPLLHCLRRSLPTNQSFAASRSCVAVRDG